MRSLRRGRSLRALSAAVAASVAAVTLLGFLGASPGTAVVQLTDGGSWLWSTAKGWVTHVNGPSGKPDFNVELAASRGHRVELTQDGVSVLVTDLETGVVSRIDPATMELVSRSFGQSGPVRVVALGELAYVIETATGTVTRIDPRTLDIVGAQVLLGAPVTGAGLDADRVLWVALAGRGDLVAIRDGRVATTVSVAAPGAGLTMTMAAGRPVAVDADKPALVPVASQGLGKTSGQAGDDQAAERPVALPPPAGPGRLLVVAPVVDGRVVPVLVAGTSTVLLIDLAADDGRGSVRQIELAGQRPSTELGAPLIAAGRVYVPDNGSGQVFVYDQVAGRFDEPIHLSGGPGMLTLSVRNGTVWVNDADGTNAVAVDPDGQRRRVDKYAPDAVVPVVDTSAKAPPPPVTVPSAEQRQPPPSARRSQPPGPDAPTVPDQRTAPIPAPNPTATQSRRPQQTVTRSPVAPPPSTTTPPPAPPGAPSVSLVSGSGVVVVTVTAGAGGPATQFALTTDAGGATVLPGPGPVSATVEAAGCQQVLATATATGPGGTSVASAPAQALSCVPPGRIQDVLITGYGPGGGGWYTDITWEPPADAGGGTVEYVVTESEYSSGDMPPRTYTTTTRTVSNFLGNPGYKSVVITPRNEAGSGPSTTINSENYTSYRYYDSYVPP
ncbi:hypothetical protein [Parafrankia sp. EUN1f]|uniref:hypothetical protein n=1 Tax=Parafrankia sp. EUN1f TaxID=102897 RepID=UPI0001C470DA|nr:hypothetical protein [Parafrankia sp. EUN1f]EFC80019.1 hypothetical protein FrEUN1fDRAFT_6853 [Parafrankia sp. EUN1f]